MCHESSVSSEIGSESFFEYVFLPATWRYDFAIFLDGSESSQWRRYCDGCLQVGWTSEADLSVLFDAFARMSSRSSGGTLVAAGLLSLVILMRWQVELG